MIRPALAQWMAIDTCETVVYNPVHEGVETWIINTGLDGSSLWIHTTQSGIIVTKSSPLSIGVTVNSGDGTALFYMTLEKDKPQSVHYSPSELFDVLVSWEDNVLSVCCEDSAAEAEIDGVNNVDKAR